MSGQLAVKPENACGNAYASSLGLRFFGRPPRLPFSRALAALASLVRPLFACPPSRPSATAAGFLRGTADGTVGQVDAAPVGGECRVASGEGDKPFRHGVGGEGSEVGGAVCVRHVQIIPKPLWVCQQEKNADFWPVFA
jgi:hypothetical protein